MRFNSNHDDENRFFDDYNEDFDDNDDDAPDMDDDDDFFDDPYDKAVRMAEIEVAEAEVKCKLLIEVIRMLEKSFFWKFKSLKTKLKMIEESYRNFSQLIEEN